MQCAFFKAVKTVLNPNDKVKVIHIKAWQDRGRYNTERLLYDLAIKNVTLITNQTELYHIGSRIQGVEERKTSLLLQLRGFHFGGGAKDALGLTSNVD